MRPIEAALFSILLHGLIVATTLAMSQPETGRKPAQELDFYIIELIPSPISLPDPTGEEKEEKPATAPPALSPAIVKKTKPRPAPPEPVKAKKIAPRPEPQPINPDPAPPPAETGPPPPRKNMSSGEEAASPTTAARPIPSSSDVIPAAAPGNPAVGSSTGQGQSGPQRDVTFGQGSGPCFAKRILPEYPWQARRLGRQGKVVLRLHIDAYGHLEKVEIVESGGLLFDEASMQAAMASSYRPAMVEGTPVASTALLPITFTLKN